MAGIRINKIVEAKQNFSNWGSRIGKDETRKMVSGLLPYPLKVLRHLPGPVKNIIEEIVENAPEIGYMAYEPKSRKHDPAMPMIRSAVEMLFSKQHPDRSRCYGPEDFDALIVAGSPFSIGDPDRELQIMEELDSNDVISERIMLGKKPHTKPWNIEVISKSCVSWVKALRHVQELIDGGEIRSAIVVSFGRPSYYIDPHKIYELSNHRDGSTASAVEIQEEGESRISFGEERIILKAHDHQSSSGNGHIEGNGKSTSRKGSKKGVVHDHNPEGLTLAQQWSFSLRTCLVDLDDSQSSGDFIASQCAKSLIEISEQRGIPLDHFDAILLPQVNEIFLDKVETFLATEFRKKLNMELHIRDDLRQIVRAYCPFFDEYQKTTNKSKREICRNFCEVLKQREKPNSNGELYQLFLSQLTHNEAILFNYMKNIHSKNFRTYQEAGYTTSNSIPGGLALGIEEGRFNLDSKIAIAGGALGYSSDSLTMNAPVPVVQSVDPNAETTIDLEPQPPVQGWKNRVGGAVNGAVNRVRGALRAVNGAVSRIRKAGSKLHLF